MYDFFINSLNFLVDVGTTIVTYVTAIPRGIADVTFYINNMPPFVSPFLAVLLSAFGIKAVLSII